jgi:hypothetical protein
MKVTTYSVNKKGEEEIRGFLINNDKQGKFFEGLDMSAWVAEAEFQLSEGNPASIEIKAHDHIMGYVEDFTVSREGLDSEIIEIED